MSRTMPTECEHGAIIDWGDFGDGPPERCTYWDSKKQETPSTPADLAAIRARFSALLAIDPGPGRRDMAQHYMQDIAALLERCGQLEQAGNQLADALTAMRTDVGLWGESPSLEAWRIAKEGT